MTTSRAIEIRPATRMDCLPFIYSRHYAKRMPSLSLSWALFVDGALEGVVCYGTPSSAPLRSGIAGLEYAPCILELNRLCLKSNQPNHASQLVSASLRSLKNKIVISFADPTEGHIGYVYQACNFLYLGLSEKRTDWKIEGKEHMHGQTVADEFRGQKNRAALMREKYGDGFYLEQRPRKHRYAYVTGSKQFRKAATSALKYEQMPYPKGA